MSTKPTESAGALVRTLYDELHKLAQARIQRLAPGQTLQPTDLVHEAYIRLKSRGAGWSGRRHFFGAAAVAMRDIIVDHIRHKNARKRGGDHVRVDITFSLAASQPPLSEAQLLTIHAALEEMQQSYPDHAEVVLLHCFAGLPLPEVAEVMGASRRTIERRWRFARAWLHTYMQES